MKTTNTLIDDIYNLVKFKSPDRSVDAEQIIDDFGEACKDLMRKEFTVCLTSVRPTGSYGIITIM